MAACGVASSAAAAQLGRVDWASSSIGGDALSAQVRVPQRVAVTRCPPIRMMGNKNEGKGVFAPIVVLARNAIGKKQFNQIRGKAIALHSQVIGEFCKSIGADAKQRQALIRLAKKNGEKLGFLA